MGILYRTYLNHIILEKQLPGFGIVGKRPAVPMIFEGELEKIQIPMVDWTSVRYFICSFFYMEKRKGVCRMWKSWEG